MNLACAILHLEDDDNDSLFFQHALKAVSFVGIYRRVSAVAEAKRYLLGDGDYSDRKAYPMPDVVVVDTTLEGGESALDLLAWMSSQEPFRNLAKIALTGTDNPRTHQSLLAQGVMGILSKGACLVEFSASVAEVLRRC